MKGISGVISGAAPVQFRESFGITSGVVMGSVRELRESFQLELERELELELELDLERKLELELELESFPKLMF